MRVAIIGAGWYGCHIASSLLQKGCVVDIFEKENDIFLHASGHNQNRLHLGFHYPRSFVTRKQSKDGYDQFLQKYPSLVREVNSNIYAVDNTRSLLDFATYKQIMQASGLAFKEVVYPHAYFKHLDGCIETNEMVIDHVLAKAYFKERLQGSLRLSTGINDTDVHDMGDYISVRGEKYDYLINCTWGKTRKFGELDFFYEPCITYFYESTLDKEFALTIMDGQFVSLYPYVDKIYTLTSVKNTPLSRCSVYEDAIKINNNLGASDILELRDKFEKEITYYYPDFVKNFTHKGHSLSVKTKLNIESGARQSVVEKRRREIFVLSGKIDAVFHADDDICEYIFGDFGE